MLNQVPPRSLHGIVPAGSSAKAQPYRSRSETTTPYARETLPSATSTTVPSTFSTRASTVSRD